MEEFLPVQKRSFRMVSHALWLDEFPTNLMVMMDDILGPFTNYFVVVYLDDILIFNKCWEEQLHEIQQVLHTL
jgi:hypothetical protein